MKRIVKICCVLLLLAIGGGLVYNHRYCRYGYPFERTSSGLLYKRMSVGSGRIAQDGEWAQISILMRAVRNKGKENGKGDKDNQETILLDSSTTPDPFVILLNKDFRENYQKIAEMLDMVEEKQRMIFKFSPQYYWAEESDEKLDKILQSIHHTKESQLIADIKVDKIMTNEEYAQMVKDRLAAQLEMDKKLIKEYLIANNIQASSTDSGLFYIIDRASQDIPIEKNKMVKFNYTGHLLDGTIFDTNIEEVAKNNHMYHAKKSYQPLELAVGIGQLIPGWEEGLLLLKKNEKARFFIPSTLAYREQSKGALIPANAVLIFEVEIVDVISPLGKQQS